MSQTIKVLKEFKKKKNFKTLKEFHTYLVKRGFTPNYQHFAKIIAEQVNVTAEIIYQLNLAIPDISDELTLAYCQDIFPNKKYLFKTQLGTSHSKKEEELTDVKQDIRAVKSSELTQYQISILSSKKENYFLFLICTMARTPINEQEIKLVWPDVKIKSVIKDLTETGLIIQTTEGIQTYNTEIRFPAKNNQNKDSYQLFDLWDIEFAKTFQLSSIVSKNFLRRISPRYFHLIQGQIQLLLETLKVSDESELKYNTEVIQLNINLSQGQLPG